MNMLVNVYICALMKKCTSSLLPEGIVKCTLLAPANSQTDRLGRQLNEAKMVLLPKEEF